MEYYIVDPPRRLSNRRKDQSQTSVFILPRLPLTKTDLTSSVRVTSQTTLQTHRMTKIPLFPITNPLTLSRSRPLVSEINHCLLYVPFTSPNPAVTLLQLPRRGRAFPLLRMRPSLPRLPLRALPVSLHPRWSRVLAQVQVPSMLTLPPIPLVMAILSR